MKPSGYRLLLPLALLASAATAGNNPGAHEHGHAELSFAVDGDRVEVLFVSPAYNIVGFEHSARTEDQRQALAEANTWFSGTALIDTTGGTCTVIRSDVHHSGQDHDPGSSGHSGFDVTQTLECPGAGDANALTTPLTARFERLEHLDVQWAGAASQGAMRLEHGEQAIELQR